MVWTFFLTLPTVLRTSTKYCQLVCDRRPLIQKEMQTAENEALEPVLFM